MHCSAYATSSRHPAERVAYWGDTNRRFFGRLDTQIDAVEDFAARMKVYDVGALKVFRIAGSAHRVQRSRASEDSLSTEYYKLVMRVSGGGTLEQCGRRVDLVPGEWSLYDPRLPYKVVSQGATDLLVLLIPRHHLRSFRFEQLHASACADPRAHGLYSVCASFLGAMAEQIDRLPDSVGTSLADTVLGLVTATLHADKDAGDEQRTLPAVMRLRVKQYINVHLGDPDLTIETLAREMRCSKRYLHLAFEGEETTLDRYIWRTRLDRCRELFLAPGRHSAASIAYACGFNSYAHFCRAFKAHFGASPRDFLRQTRKN